MINMGHIGTDASTGARIPTLKVELYTTTQDLQVDDRSRETNRTLLTFL